MFMERLPKVLIGHKTIFIVEFHNTLILLKTNYDMVGVGVKWGCLLREMQRYLTRRPLNVS